MVCGPTLWFGPAVGGLWLLGCGLVASPLYFSSSFVSFIFVLFTGLKSSI
jgi:hypothetical protein